MSLDHQYIYIIYEGHKVRVKKDELISVISDIKVYDMVRIFASNTYTSFFSVSHETTEIILHQIRATFFCVTHKQRKASTEWLNRHPYRKSLRQSAMRKFIDALLKEGELE